MMGRNHARLGALLLVLLVALLAAISSGTGLVTVGIPWWLVPVPVLAVAALQYNGGTVAPDIDGPSIATASFWPLTKLISLLVRGASKTVYVATRGPRDLKGRGTHRYLTHTAIGNVLSGLLLAGACSIDTGYGPVPGAIALGVVAGMGAMALKRSWKWPVALATALTGYAVLHAAGPGVGYWPWLWGLAFTFGCAVHCIGDGCTETGVPYWWHPFKRDAKRWTRDHVLPERLRFTTGKVGESLVIGIVCCFTVVLGTLLVVFV